MSELDGLRERIVEGMTDENRDPGVAGLRLGGVRRLERLSQHVAGVLLVVLVHGGEREPLEGVQVFEPLQGFLRELVVEEPCRGQGPRFRAGFGRTLERRMGDQPLGDREGVAQDLVADPFDVSDRQDEAHAEWQVAAVALCQGVTNVEGVAERDARGEGIEDEVVTVSGSVAHPLGPDIAVRHEEPRTAGEDVLEDPQRRTALFDTREPGEAHGVQEQDGNVA